MSAAAGPLHCGVLVIGAGPFSLTFCSRWRRQQSHQNGGERLAQDVGSLLAVDPSGSWLCSWQSHFEALFISHLRSPATWHCGPSHSHAMKQLWARGILDRYPSTGCSLDEQQTADDRSTVEPLLFRNNVVPPTQPSLSQPSSDCEQWADLALPSNEMFLSHCRYLVDKYSLDRCLLKGTVECVEAVCISPFSATSTILNGGSFVRPRYVVRLQDGASIYCRYVVSCVGNLRPRMPNWATDALHSIPDELRAAYQDTLLHTSALVHQRASVASSAATAAVVDHAQPRVAPTSVLIVGGGLTSAQLATLLLKAAYAHNTSNSTVNSSYSRSVSSTNIDLSCGVRVYLVMRGACRQQQFDLTSPWMGRQRYDMQRDWQSVKDKQQRFRLIRQARNGGGSIPRHVVRQLLPFLTHLLSNDGSASSDNEQPDKQRPVGGRTEARGTPRKRHTKHGKQQHRQPHRVQHKHHHYHHEDDGRGETEDDEDDEYFDTDWYEASSFVPVGRREAEGDVELGLWRVREDGCPCECSMLTYTAVRSCMFVADSQQARGPWRVHMTQHGGQGMQRQQCELVEHFDHVWLATGCAPPAVADDDSGDCTDGTCDSHIPLRCPSFSSLQLFSPSLLASHLVLDVGGSSLPVLDANLQWKMSGANAASAEQQHSTGRAVHNRRQGRRHGRRAGSDSEADSERHSQHESGQADAAAMPAACCTPSVRAERAVLEEGRSGSGIYFAGALACLELGPSAFNLAGARTAARLICRAIGETVNGAA